MKALPLPRAKGMLKARTVSHEEFIHAVRAIVASRPGLDVETRNMLHATKLTYGSGESGTRGICYYGAWANGAPRPYDFITICATGEESVTQLVGTTVHELGHVLAGHGKGHGAEWKAACARLGLAKADAAGQCYAPEHFTPEYWREVLKLERPSDGTPAFQGTGAGLIPWVGLPTFRPRPCPLGIGTRGGKSRGAGSGSRLRLWTCQCSPAVKVRVASDTFAAHCDVCGAAFTKG